MTRVLCINPGSTSMKVAVFEGETAALRENIAMPPEVLAQFSAINDQLGYRMQQVLDWLEANGISLDDLDGFAARGGGVVQHPSGTYRVNEAMVADVRSEAIASHPAQLAVQIAYELSQRTGKPAFMTDSTSTEEVLQVAHVTGIKNVIRHVYGHALNSREVVRRYASSIGKRRDELNAVVCHLGGGISVTAHRHGRMIDLTSNITGEGPMTPNRSGALAAYDVIDLCFQPDATRDSVRRRLTSQSGLLDHLGTDDVREVVERVTEGDVYATNVYHAMIYQTAKAVGEMVAVLKGQVDAIILTGGIAYDDYFCKGLESFVSTFAPVVNMAGEFEMEALAAGAIEAIESGSAKAYPPEHPWSRAMLETVIEPL